MNEYLKFIIEFVVAYILVFLFYYFAMIRQYNKLDKKKVPTEVNIILRYHQINLEKINYKAMLIMLTCVTSFIIALNITVIHKFTNSNIIVILVTVLVSLPIALVCYDLIGKHFEKQSKNKTK